MSNECALATDERLGVCGQQDVLPVWCNECYLFHATPKRKCMGAIDHQEVSGLLQVSSAYSTDYTNPAFYHLGLNQQHCSQFDNYN